MNIIRTIKRHAALLAAALLLAVAAAPTPALAACTTGTSSGSKNQVVQGIQSTGTDCSQNGEQTLTQGILKIVSYIAGLVAIIMIIVSGFRYITSGGDPGKVGSAKGALLGAIIGLVVAVMAQLIVHIVLSNAH
ncbi:MAG: pilin [Candidatus Saccharimonadales bacterium]